MSALGRRAAITAPWSLLAYVPVQRRAVALPAGPVGFQRGVNLSAWLQLTGEEAYTPSDLATLRRSGFDHARLPFDGYTLGWRPGAVSQANLVRIRDLDAAVEQVLASGLNLILDFHPGDETISLLRADRNGETLALLWGQLAERYRGMGNERVVFELMNEPQRVHGTDSRAWYAAQMRILRAIRAASDAWVLSSGVWHPDTRLRTVRLLDDRKILYGTDLYEPLELTHMGADWDDAQRSGRGALRNLRYPAHLTDRGLPLAEPGTNWSRADALARRYISEGWDIGKLRERATIMAQWSRAQGVPVHCAEFGVIRGHLDHASRLRWLRDARTALDEAGISWTLWDLACTFGIVEVLAPTAQAGGRICPPRPEGGVRLMPDLLEALGLG
ncbi:MAG: cellulase family protein [Rhodospirillales bacterium]|jgi:endoglucanase|nr:cellulase family protein [Rhodospirillales bacterium]MDB5382317.1 cellulase family protein [Rhodospirillales bacterium]